MVMDVLNIQNGQKSLERLADLLAKIQKALGEYLERERASFPRFYFVGDEDLLEIIGNTKNIPRYLLDAVGSSGILKGKQKLGVTFNSDKLGGIDFTKFSKLTMCSA